MADWMRYLPTVWPRKNTVAVYRPADARISAVHRFHAPDWELQRETTLPAGEAHHLARVLRLRPGDRVELFDGRGQQALGVVESTEGERVRVRAVERTAPAPEPGVAITLAQALLKSDKMDRVIRDAVMLGAAAVQPLMSGRTELPRAAAGAAGRLARWERTVLSSVKQCGRAVLPPVLAPVAFDAAMEAIGDALALMFVEPAGHPGAPGRFSLESLENRVPARTTVFIGPEGGWTDGELQSAARAGVRLVTLGRRTLRAEAAAAAAIAVLQYIWKDSSRTGRSAIRPRP